MIQEAVAIKDIPLPPKIILTSNLTKSRPSVTSISIAKSFWNFAHSMAAILPCCVQNSKAILQLQQPQEAHSISDFFP